MTDEMEAVIIEAKPTFSSVGRTDEWVLDLLEEYLSFDDAANQFIMVRGQVRRRTDSPKLRLFNLIDRTFPTGLLSLVCKHMRELDIPYRVIEKFSGAELSNHDLAWLRPEQKEAVKRVIARKNGILWLPTGSGKTEIAIGLTVKIKTRWLFIVHKKDLLHQTADRYKLRTGLTAGKIGDGIFDIQEFTVATFQSLSRGVKTRDKRVLQLMKDVGGVIHDECHTAPAASSLAVLMGLHNAVYRIGLSGTPLARGDKRSIYAIGALGPVIYRIKPEVLIEAGHLAKPYIHMPELEQDSAKKTWQGVYGECIVRSTKRNKLLTEFAKLADKPALLFVKEVKHGHELENRVRKAGVSCEFLWGEKSTAKRDAAVRRLITGDIDVLIVSVIFQEGTDIPDIRSVIVGSAGKSAIAAIQRVGRGMRVVEGKKEFHVYDVFDTGHRTLKKWAKERKAAYELEGYTVVVHDEF